MLAGGKLGLYHLKKHGQSHRNNVMRRDGVLRPGDVEVVTADPCERLAQRFAHCFSACWGWVTHHEQKEQEFNLNMLSAKQLRQLRWAFNVVDEDKSGYIQGKELQQVAQLLGDNPTQFEADGLLHLIDKNTDGQVSFEEFARSWWHRPSGQEEIEAKREEIEMAFRIFDADSVSRSHRRPRRRGVARCARRARPLPVPSTPFDLTARSDAVPRRTAC